MDGPLNRSSSYVDDLLYMGEKNLVLNVYEKISSIWPCSTLEFVKEFDTVECLRCGMELASHGCICQGLFCFALL